MLVEVDAAGAAEVCAAADELCAGAAEVACAVLVAVVDVLVVDELLLRATTIIASKTTAAITAMTTREDERCALAELEDEDFGGVAAAAARGRGVEEIVERPLESGTSGITMREAESFAVFFEERFAVFLTAAFLTVFLTARLAEVFLAAAFLAVFLTVRLAVFLTARLAEIFLATDFFAGFLAVFFTATLSPLGELIIENHLILEHKLLRK